MTAFGQERTFAGQVPGGVKSSSVGRLITAARFQPFSARSSASVCCLRL